MFTPERSASRKLARRRMMTTALSSGLRERAGLPGSAAGLWPPPEPVALPERAFEAQIREFTTRYAALWHATQPRTPQMGEPSDRHQQRDREGAADALIRSLEAAVQRYPDSEPERAAWRERFFEELRPFATRCLGFSERCQQIMFSPAYRHVTTEFVCHAKAFDPTIQVEDLFQALRNVWIANSLQILLDREVTLSPALFAYSMLYPFTDNYLDDPRRPDAAKRQMDDWLGRRLHGLPVSPPDAHGRDIVRLVELIDGDYPANNYPEVRLSLRAIHRAQISSLGQQDRRHPLSAAELLQISIEKGGTSVLADGYLVAGRLSEAEADFLFGYGVLLQLLDDLQDVGRDLRAGHATLFSRDAPAGPLDELTSRLCDFMRRVLGFSERFADRRFDAVKELIERGCRLLILQAVALNVEFFSPAFAAALESYSPFGFAFIRDRRRTLERKYRKARRTLERERGLDSILRVLS